MQRNVKQFQRANDKERISKNCKIIIHIILLSNWNKQQRCIC